MKKSIGFFAAMFLLSFPLGLLGQATITGSVSDAATGEALAGANVVVEGTTLGAAADANGSFSISNVPVGTHTVTASVIGYELSSRTVTVPRSGSVTVDFALATTTLQLSAVTVQGNFARERETPVAFTTIGEDHIRNNFTVQDVPHLFANTPGVYVTTDGGSGMGDSKVTIRGFDEQRIAVMINNVPVNDPESKKVYWSNWGSLPAASQSIQIQRGVGSSLYGSGALGGSINVITKDAPANRSIGFSFTGGQYGIIKLGIDYNTGLLGGNKAFIARFNYLEGNGWRQDTFYRGIQYYFSAMMYPNEKNTFKIILHGAPQYHAYAYMGFSPANFADTDDIDPNGSILDWGSGKWGSGRKEYYGNYSFGFGRDWNGHPHLNEAELPEDEKDRTTKLMDVLFNRTKIGDSKEGGWVIGNNRASLDNNVYHKPQFEIHHSMKLGPETKLTSTFFVSNGYGYGENVQDYFRIPRDTDGLQHWDETVVGSDTIKGLGTGGYYGDKYNWQYRNYSDHFQTGLLSSYDTKIGAHDLTAGAELRWWKARHAGEVLNTFSTGSMSYYIGNKKQTFTDGELYYDYTTTKPQFTAFGHALWRFGNLNLMTDVQFSNLNYHIIEDVPSSNNYPEDTEEHGGDTWTGTATDDAGALIEYTLWDYKKSFSYISPKLGVNYNITDEVNVFVNWSSAVNEPRVKYFFGYGSPNELLDLEKTNDYEFGLGYKGELAGFPLDTKLNLYQINFEGKALRITDPTKANTPGYDYKGRRYLPIGESTYKGLELSLNTELPMGIDLGINLSKTSNEWGEPEDSEGAQYLYSNADVVAGTDYTDTDGDGKWDVGELALHEHFFDDFGARTEVGTPQLIYGGTLNWSNGPLNIGLAMRHYQDSYIWENNDEVLVGPGKDGKYGNDDDEMSATLPAATVLDVVVRYNLPVMSGLNLSLHIANLMDTEYWQSGDSYGVKPGAARTVILNFGVTL